MEMAERLPERHPDVLDLPMGRTDMADHLGLTIETVCRVMRPAPSGHDRGRARQGHDPRQRWLQQMASEPRH